MKKSQCKSDAELLSSLLNAPCTLFEGRSLADMLRAPLTFEGIGEKRAEKLYDLQEVTRRLMVREAERQITVIHGPEDVAHAIMPRFRYESKEHFSRLDDRVCNFCASRRVAIACATSARRRLTATVSRSAEVAHSIVGVSAGRPVGGPRPWPRAP